MNWTIYRLSDGEREKLEQTEVGRRLLELQKEGYKVLTRNIWLRTIATIAMIASCAGLVTYLIPPTRQYTDMVIIFVSMAALMILVASEHFMVKNMKTEAFQKIHAEFLEIIGNNSPEKEIVERMANLNNIRVGLYS